MVKNRNEFKRSALMALVSLGIFGVAGCGNSVGNGASSSLSETAAASRGSVLAVSSATSKAVQLALNAALPANGSPAALTADGSSVGSLNDESDSSDVAFTSCTETNGGDGSVTVRCDCFDGEKTQGFVTTTLKGGFSEDRCVLGAEQGGSILSGSQTFEMRFEGCVYSEACGDSVVMSGKTSGSIQSIFNECAGTGQFLHKVQTAGSCSGLTMTFPDGKEVESGFSIQTESFGEDDKVNGSICTDGKSVAFSSWEELDGLTDPEDDCHEPTDFDPSDGETDEENPMDPGSMPQPPTSSCDIPAGTPEKHCGTLTFLSASDVAAAADCTSADWIYMHQANGPSSVVLPYLKKINGSVYFHQTAGVASLEMPCLEEVSEFLYFHQNSTLKTISMPNLLSVGWYAYFHQNVSLEGVYAPSLTVIGAHAAPDPDYRPGYLYAYDNQALRVVDFSGLNQISGYLHIVDHPLLESMDLSAITSVQEYVNLAYNPLWTTLPAAFWSSVNGGQLVNLVGNAP